MNIRRRWEYGKNNNPIRRFPTTCCALGILSANIDHTEFELSSLLASAKLENQKIWSINNREGGERAYIVVTTPDEKILEETLIKVGFTEIYQFSRRNGYPEGMLKLWIISW